jgi:hypothetical protein
VGVRLRVADCVTALSVAVTLTFCAVVTVPVVAVNVVLLWFATTIALPGTVTPLPLPRDTAVALATDLLKAIVHVLAALLPNVLGAHVREVNCAGALAVTVNVCELLPSLAVRTAGWSEVTAAAVAVKVSLVWFCATVTLPGTVTFPLLLPSDTTAPPDAAGEVNVTMHVDVPGAFTVAGEQLRLAI